MSDSAPLLDGLLVIDCATYIAAPAAAVMLADFGAEVVKIERAPVGDPYRVLRTLPGLPICERDYFWLLDNRNKKSLPLDLKQAAAREALDRLIRRADVFITNYQPALLEKFDLGFERLAELNPKLIYAHLTAYGDHGPDKDLPAYDQTAYWARSGLMALIHNAGSEPSRAPSGMGDHPAATALFAAVMTALYRREKTGLGGRVTTSLLANGAWANGCQIQAELLGATYWPRGRRETCTNALANHYVTRDGRRFLVCCVDDVKDWPKFCRAIGMPELISDPRFATVQARVDNAEPLIALVDQAIAGRDLAEWSELFREHDVLWSPVSDLAAAATDRQMIEAGVLPEVDHPEYGRVRTVATPVHLDGVQKTPPAAAPEIGEHTREILLRLGYDEETIDDMARSGATVSASRP